MKPSLEEQIIQKSDTTTTTKPSNTKQVHNSQQLAAGHQKCPRCDSTNTKFCYYNNYSLTQPRHFCKTCRRYWTKGGALRNVPIGGGCRKTKKLKSSSSSSASSSTNNFKFFSAMPPSIDFGVGLSSSPLFSRSCVNLDPPLTPTSPTTNNYPFMGLNNNNSFPLIHHSSNNMNSNTDIQLASSIESLSSLNQDLHWKLQQQRLAAMFRDHDRHQVQNFDHQNQKLLQPILFQNLEAPKQDTCFNVNHPGKESVAAAGEDATTTTEWFFGNNNNSLSAANSATNYDIDGSGWSNNNDTNGVQDWEDLHHFTALP